MLTFTGAVAITFVYNTSLESHEHEIIGEGAEQEGNMTHIPRGLSQLLCLHHGCISNANNRFLQSHIATSQLIP